MAELIKNSSINYPTPNPLSLRGILFDTLIGFRVHDPQRQMPHSWRWKCVLPPQIRLRVCQNHDRWVPHAKHKGEISEGSGHSEDRYGNSFAIADAFRTKLTWWPKVGLRDAEGLKRYSGFLNQCAVTKKVISGMETLDDCLEIKRFVSLLPDWTLSRWCTIVTAYKDTWVRYPDFNFVAEFVSSEATGANDPVFSFNALKGVAESSNVPVSSAAY